LATLTGCGGGSAAAPAGASAPQAPAAGQAISLSTTVGSPTKVTISWIASKVSGDKYEIYRNGKLDASAAGTADGTYDTGLAPATQYCYQVTVVNSTGTGM